MPRLGVWPPLPPAVYLRRPARGLPWPLEDERCTLYARGRNALLAGLSALGLADGEEVLMPAYNHGSEVEAVLRAGLRPRFYEANETLEPDVTELERMLEERTRALYLIHYLGFPQDASRWRRWCDERGLLLVEDAAQAWLATRDGAPAGSHGDLAIFCLYKTVGVPDGAALVTHDPPAAADRGSSGLWGLVWRHGAWVTSRLPWPRPDRPAESGDGEFRVGPASAPSLATRLLLTRAVEPAVDTTRRENYRALLEVLGEHVPSPLAELPEGASPFAFPVVSERKAELLARLWQAGVAALDFWSVPHPAIPADGFDGAARRRATTVALPVHQCLRPRDLRLLGTAVR
jgi:selenocysteine lyase/cysteine desulfurase